MGHEGNGPSGGEPRYLGVLGASRDVFALDRVMVEVLGVDPALVPTIGAAEALGCCVGEMTVVGTNLADLQIQDWRLPDRIMPIDFGLPRILRSTFKHLYIKFIQERMQSYVLPQR